MKQTLLSIVQDILSEIDGDEVDSINDTQESLDIARIVRQSYYHIAGIVDLPEHFDYYSLDVVGTDQPTLMRLPSNVISTAWVKYDIKTEDETNKNYQDVPFLNMDDLIRQTNSLSTEQSWVTEFPFVLGAATINFKCRNDKTPSYYTSWDDQYVLFDSYDAAVDNNLQQSKTWCYGLLDTTFVPDLDHKQFPLLYNEALSVSNISKRQQANPKAEARAKHNWINTERTKRGIPSPMSELNKTPDFGRKGPMSSSIIRALRQGA